MGLQASGGLDLTHLTAQGLLDKGKGLLVLLLVLFLLLGLTGQVQIAVGGGTEGLILIGPKNIGQKLVGFVGNVVHSVHRVAGGKVDVLLALLHTGDVLVQRHQLFLGGGIEQHQILKHILLLAVVVHGTELDLTAEGLPEGLILLAFVPQQTLQLGLDLFFQVGADEL